MPLRLPGPQWPPIEPPPSRWRFDLSRAEPDEDLLTAGGDLEAGTVLAAYRAGAFPMGIGRHGARPIGWWSPDPRGILLPGGVRVSRSLAASARRFEIRVNTAFDEVITACADRRREGRWITDEIVSIYRELHWLGWVHSVETWRDGTLAGGLYGLMIGGLFAGESMFYRERDASKVALLGLVERFFSSGADGRLIDVQWQTPHLATLGVLAVSREDYLARLERALGQPSVPL